MLGRYGAEVALGRDELEVGRDEVEVASGFFRCQNGGGVPWSPTIDKMANSDWSPQHGAPRRRTQICPVLTGLLPIRLRDGAFA